MDKVPFKISIVRANATAQVRITGEIGWEVSAEDFRRQIDALVTAGVTDAHVYINSPGGNCFDASEIVNILSKFKNITGEGGAIVASAATYIAAHCKNFTMPENGLFMVHKPSGGCHGTSDDMQSYLDLLKKIEKEYYDTYSAIVKDKAAFDAVWGVRDYWLDASEAKAQGFVSKVMPKIKIDKETSAVIKACGCDNDKLNHIFNNQNNSEMDVKVTALSLGLSAEATEAEVAAKIAENAVKVKELETLRAKIEADKKTEQTAKIKAELDKAIVEKRITAETRPAWEKMLQDNFETANAALQAIAPVEKLSSQNGIVLDPFMGAGTTALVARECGCNYIGVELNPEYVKIAEKRLE